MKICFIMYPWSTIEPIYDSTLRMIHECVKRSHTVAIGTSSNLTIRGNITQAYVDVFKKQDKISTNFSIFYKSAKFNRCQLPLAGFDVIFMREDPPLNNIALNFLDSVKSDTFIVNDINGLRVANNKLYTSSFNDENNEFMPITYASKNKDYLERVLKESPTDKMILKPLNGHGGAGVILVEKRAISSFRSLLDFYLGNGKHDYVILQEYVDGAEAGDVRILMLNGEFIGAMKRIPAHGEVRSNVSTGGTVEKHTLTKQERKLCRFIGPKLVRDGLFFVGIDVINGKLIEVNVQTPGGISRINTLNKVKLQVQIIDFVEDVVKTRNALLSRKSALSRIIDDASII